ncbi:hypothetical protein PENSPDRAFT_652372 [Peniophora sp. CONT]|nr:hypothetical protein PENSPDRAFT_652372 [Peniophora sp. CONT]
MDFFSQTYTALRGPQGAPQTAEETIARLSDRLSPETQLADRRASVLALKGLTRKHRPLVASQSLPGLVRIIREDALHDPEIARAALETVYMLVDTTESTNNGPARDVALQIAGKVLEDPGLTHATCALLGDEDFYVRFAACQLLGALLQSRPQAVQTFFLTAPGGPTRVVTLLEDSRDMLAREALHMLSMLLRKSGEIQKVLAFDGVFEKLFGIITREGGLDGGEYVEEALKCVDMLLRFNQSNQSYFLETPLPAALCSLLYFNPGVRPEDPAPQEFALQFWSPGKAVCAALVIDIIGLLLAAKGPALREGYAYTRMLIELSFASNAPTSVKVQALRHLPADATPMLPEIVVTPYVPVPETNGEEWDKLEAATALDALIELIMHGEYNGVDAERRAKPSMDLRASAVGVFENFIRDDSVKEAIVAGMLPPEDAGPNARSPLTPLLFGLLAPPKGDTPPDRVSVVSFQFASVLLAHLLRHTPPCKNLARQIIPPPLNAEGGGAFFVPADGGAPPQPEEKDEDEDEAQSLLQILTEHLSLAFLARTRDGLSEADSREWDRWLIAYLSLLSQWLWEDPKAVRTFLEAGGMGFLIEQLNQPSETDIVVPGLCAFLLGITYEFNRDTDTDSPSEITRHSMFNLLSRLGQSTLSGRLTRLRDDDRLKVVAPDVWVLTCPTPASLAPGFQPRYDDEAEIWFDWAFVDFWKSVNQTIMRAIMAEPDAPPQTSAQSGEESMLVSSLRDALAKQAGEIDGLKRQLAEAATSQQASSASQAELTAMQQKLSTVEADLITARGEIENWKTQAEHSAAEAAAAAAAAAAKSPPPAPSPPAPTYPDLSSELETLKSELEAERTKRAEVEKEQEDLLVLLDEISDKRKKDKAKMREAGWEVSEDEDEGDDEDEDEE